MAENQGKERIILCNQEEKNLDSPCGGYSEEAGNTVSTISQRETYGCRHSEVGSLCRYHGLPCRIRTCGLLLPKQTRYQAAPMVEVAPQVGLEPTTTRLTAEDSAIELLWNVVRPEGFEPSTSGIEARCSVH